MPEKSNGRGAGRLLLGGAFLASLVGLLTCMGQSAPSPEPRFANGKTAVENEALARVVVEDRLRDPKSAVWGAIYVRDIGTVTVTCGSVNSTNGFGGKSGQTPFVVTGRTALFASDLTPATFNEVWKKNCG